MEICTDTEKKGCLKTAMLFYVLEGRVEFEYDRRKVELKESDLLVINRGTEYMFRGMDHLMMATLELMGKTFEAACDGVRIFVNCNSSEGEYQPRWLVGGDKGAMIIQNFACDGKIYRTGKMLEKLPPEITETEAGPTRQFAPVAPGGILTEELPKVESDWVEFYKNVDDVLNERAESKIKIPEVRRVLSVMEAVWESADTGKAVAFE